MLTSADHVLLHLTQSQASRPTMISNALQGRPPAKAFAPRRVQYMLLQMEKNGLVNRSHWHGYWEITEAGKLHLNLVRTLA